LRESKKRRKFPFSEEGFSAKKWHEFQGKEGHGLRGKTAAREESVRYGFGTAAINFLHRPYSSSFLKAEGRIY
jgi:hypothetical protein